MPPHAVTTRKRRRLNKMLPFRHLLPCALALGLLAEPRPVAAQGATAAPPARLIGSRIAGAEATTETKHPLATRLDSLRAAYRVARAPVTLLPVNGSLGAPGSSFGSPTAFGAAAWDAFAGLGVQKRTRFTQSADAAFVVGIGFGNVDTLGAVEVAITSFSTVRKLAGSVGSSSLKYHHGIAYHMRGAVGVENLLSWGDTDGGRSLYAVVARAFQLREVDGGPFGAMSVAVGVGNGRFRSESDVIAHRQKISPFASAGFRLNSITSFAADWTGEDLNAGFAFIPITGRGLTFTIGAADLTHSAGDGARLIMSVGYGVNLHADGRRLSREEQRNVVPR